MPRWHVRQRVCRVSLRCHLEPARPSHLPLASGLPGWGRSPGAGQPHPSTPLHQSQLLLPHAPPTQGKFALCAYAICVPIEGSNPLVAECGCLAFNQVVATGVYTHCADHLGPTGWHELGSDPARQFAVLSPQAAAHPDPGVIWRFWIDRHPERAGAAAAPLATVDATVVRLVPGICHQQLNRWGEQRWRGAGVCDCTILPTHWVAPMRHRSPIR